LLLLLLLLLVLRGAFAWDCFPSFSGALPLAFWGNGTAGSSGTRPVSISTAVFTNPNTKCTHSSRVSNSNERRHPSANSSVRVT
jgi:hypothetical protein